MGDHVTEIVVFTLLFLLVSGMGFVAARWRAPNDMAHLDEWGLGGRSFGGWITWFLVGGDLYTAYTFVAVPALLFGAGAAGFFAVPYTIIIYPLVLPGPGPALVGLAPARLRHPGRLRPGPVRARRRWRCWSRSPASSRPCPTSRCSWSASRPCSRRWASPARAARPAPADHHRVRDPGRVHVPVRPAGAGADRVRQGHADLHRDHRRGHLPALQAGRLGRHLRARPTPSSTPRPAPNDGILLNANNQLQYITLALGSALALFLYPHSITGVLASKNRDVIKRNMSALPAYSLLLGLIALLGYMAIAAGVKPLPGAAGTGADSNTVVPLLFDQQFPAWFAGRRVRRDRHRRAGAGGDHVDRRGEPVHPQHLQGVPAQGRHATRRRPTSRKIASLVVKVGAVACIVFLDPQFSIDLQLIGGVIILQTLPAVALGLYTRWFHRGGLIAGWVAGMGLGLWMLYQIPNAGHRPRALRRLGVPAVEVRASTARRRPSTSASSRSPSTCWSRSSSRSCCGPARCPTAATAPSRTTTSPTRATRGCSPSRWLARRRRTRRRRTEAAEERRTA